jgi:hypothetical protein
MKKKARKPRRLPKKTGRPQLHGVHASLIYRQDALKKYPEIMQGAIQIRESIVGELGGQPSTTARLKVNQIVNLWSLCRLMEAHVSEGGIFRGRHLEPILDRNYLAYSNSLRLAIQSLGLSDRTSESIMQGGRLDIRMLRVRTAVPRPMTAGARALKRSLAAYRKAGEDPPIAELVIGAQDGQTPEAAGAGLGPAEIVEPEPNAPQEQLQDEQGETEPGVLPEVMGLPAEPSDDELEAGVLELEARIAVVKQRKEDG